MFFSIFLTTDDTVECMKGLSLRAAVVGNGDLWNIFSRLVICTDFWASGGKGGLFWGDKWDRLEMKLTLSWFETNL